MKLIKKILLSLIISIGVGSALAGISLIRLSKAMEEWEASWDEEIDEQDND